MSRLARPVVWLPLALLLLAGGGGVLLAQPACTPLTDRAAEYFLGYEYARCAFDALSAACGVGLLTRDLGDEYTAAGQWALTGIGLGGALLWLAAVTQALRRMGASLTIWAAPPVWVVLGFFIAWQIVLAAAFTGWTRLGDEPLPMLDALRAAIAAFASLGLIEPGEITGAGLGVGIAVLAWISALGWPMWLFVVPALNRRHIQARHALVIAGTYTLLLLLLAGVAALAERPRTGLAAHAEGQPPPAAHFEYARPLVRVVAAAGAGIATEPLAEADLGDGAKLVLSLAVLVGSAGYAAGGGITWILLIWALTAAVFGGAGRTRQPPHFVHWFQAGLSCALLIGALAVVGAAGLLVIENLTGSRFEHPPALADALLEASSAVGGANLTTGLTQRVTAENLTGGQNLATNLFPVGMTWLMLLMLLGRLVPLFMLQRVADAVTPEERR